MRRSIAYREPELISTINTTPLIDVMLVLLIMMIITIPTANHKIPVELPTGIPSTQTDMPHRLDIAASGALSWDGGAITDAQLPALLSSTVAMKGVLHLKADEAARYERFSMVLAQVKRAGVTRLGFIGNERMTID